MRILGTFDFLKTLAVKTIQGDPLSILDDIRETQGDEAKKDQDAIETTAEVVEEKDSKS